MPEERSKQAAPSRDAFRLDGKRALVTGGASGIGEATCRELVAAGAHVSIADINLDQARRLASDLGNADAIRMDVTDPDSVSSALATLTGLDILVNNAGIGHVGDITHTELDDLSRILDVNVKSVYIVTRAAFPLLLASRASIVNIGSVAGLIGIRHRLAYCTSKGAVIAMTRQIAVDYPKELRINCICPGTVDTPFVESYLTKYHPNEKERVRAEVTARQPIGRLGKAEEIASMVRYLCSAEADIHQRGCSAHRWRLDSCLKNELSERSMKLVTFLQSDSTPRPGILDSDSVLDLSKVGFPDMLSFIKVPLSTTQEISSLPRYSLKNVSLLAPIMNPPRIFCVGLNYRDHAVESNMAIPAVPTIFLKLPSSIIGPGAAIEYLQTRRSQTTRLSWRLLSAPAPET